MSSRLLAQIAYSLLMARWKQTLVAAIGVTFSITMFITLLSFMTGLNKLLDGLILNRTPHVRLYNEIRPDSIQPAQEFPAFKGQYHMIRSVKSGKSRQEIYNSAAIMDRITDDKDVTGIAPKITAQVFFNEGNLDITGAVFGIDVDAETKLFFFDDYIVKGNAADLKHVSNSIILGTGLADKLLAEPGDMVQLTTAQGEQFRLKVVGLFQSGIQEFDKTQSFASLGTVQKLLLKPNNYVTDIQVKLTDVSKAPEKARSFRRLFGVDAEDIQTANSQFETGTTIRTIISYAVGITLLVVAGFGIYNILNMMIYEKMDSIAILKATGFSGTDVKRIFLLIALGIGFFGGATGLLFGYLLSSIIDQIPFNTAALPTVTTYPINYNPLYYMIGGTFSLLTTYFAGYFPARKASKVDPVVIIRGK